MTCIETRKIFLDMKYLSYAVYFRQLKLAGTLFQVKIEENGARPSYMVWRYSISFVILFLLQGYILQHIFFFVIFLEIHIEKTNALSQFSKSSYAIFELFIIICNLDKRISFIKYLNRCG